KGCVVTRRPPGIAPPGSILVQRVGQRTFTSYAPNRERRFESFESQLRATIASFPPDVLDRALLERELRRYLEQQWFGDQRPPPPEPLASPSEATARRSRGRPVKVD